MNNTIDYIEEFDMASPMSLAERELKGSREVFQFTSSVSGVTKNGASLPIDTKDIDNAAIFIQNFKYWNQETELLSTNNLDNSYFKEIVNMGIDAVPFIVDELKKGPTQLVHALDLIFPDVVKYEGFVSLKDACDKWLSILQ